MEFHPTKMQREWIVFQEPAFWRSALRTYVASTSTTSAAPMAINWFASSGCMRLGWMRTTIATSSVSTIKKLFDKDDTIKFDKFWLDK
jgi:hypothetical protein